MERQKEGASVNFNLTPEQQEKFNAIYEETKILYPHLVSDETSISRVKVLIAYSVINGKPQSEIQEEEKCSTYIDNNGED
jgi:hypothetical protein